MATIAENIQTLRSIKSDIKNAITDKGGNVGNDFKTYAQAITNLPSGGGNEDLVNLIERDITSLSIPDGTTKIGYGAFYNCSSLTSVTIPNRVTSIGYGAFSFCSSLTSVTISNSVTSIDGSAFYGCSRLTRVTIKATTPPTLTSGAFNDTNNCPIYVPAESVDAYKTATNWSAYADRIQAIREVVEQPDDSQHGGGVGEGDTDVPIE